MDVSLVSWVNSRMEQRPGSWAGHANPVLTADHTTAHSHPITAVSRKSALLFRLFFFNLSLKRNYV